MRGEYGRLIKKIIKSPIGYRGGTIAGLVFLAISERWMPSLAVNSQGALLDFKPIYGLFQTVMRFMALGCFIAAIVSGILSLFR